MDLRYLCVFFEGVGRFILGLWDDIEIVESDELKEFIWERVRNFKYKPAILSN